MSRPHPRILMCRPEYYGIEYEINPWMNRQRGANRELALAQWDALVALLRRLGAAIELLQPVPGLPDLVFTANAGVVCRDLFVTSQFRHAERQGESPYFEAWFCEHGYRAVCLPGRHAFEGAGDALYCGDALFAGYIYRSEIRAHQALGALLGCQTLSLELANPHYYHLDTCFCPLSASEAIYFPGAFDEYARRVLSEHVPTLIALAEPEAARFGCNAVVVGKNIVVNTGTDQLAQQLRDHGYTPYQTDLSEFLKAGGSAKCLTLRLDGEEACCWQSD